MTRRRTPDATLRAGAPAQGGDQPDRRRTRRSSDLLARDIRDELDVQVLLRKAVGLVAPLVRAERVFVNLVQGQQIGEVGAEWRDSSLDPFWDPGKPPLSLSHVFFETAERGETIVLDDTSATKGPSKELGEYLQSLGIGAALIAPLNAAEGFLGLLTIGDTNSRSWSSDELRLTEIASDEIASALERARLFAAQQELVKQLQELDRTKSEFLSTVSHELRTPLTSISGYIEMLVDGDAGPISDEQHRMLNIVGRNARRLRSLIEDLLTLSRIEVGAFRSRAEEVHLREVIESARAVIAPSANEAGIDLVIDYSPDLGVLVGDPEQLERVLLNLLSNAIKFTQSGGRIELLARREGTEIVVSVRDSGIGIPPDDLTQLFTRFFRASNATSRAIPGTGLGLTIVASIIELHGGRIEVESTVDVGTTFTIHLPVLTA